MINNEYEIDPELLAEFVDESQEMLAGATHLFITLESDPSNKEALNTVFRAFHTIKGNSAFFNLLKVKALAHTLEDLMNLLRENKVSYSKSVSRILIHGSDQIKTMMARVREGRSETPDELGFEKLLTEIQLFIQKEKSSAEEPHTSERWQNVFLILKRLEHLLEGREPELQELLQKAHENLLFLSALKVENSKSQAVPSEQPLESLTTVQETEEETDFDARAIAAKTMRISESAIDKFLDYVGELVVIGEMYTHLQNRLAESNVSTLLLADLKKNNESFDHLSQNLQQSILELRKIPFKTLLQRAFRIANDVACERRKEVEIELKGEDLMIDKSLIEALDAPLIHLVRNAADHGIESPEKRMKAGKSPKGIIQIHATEEEENIVLKLHDDGGGINKQKVIDTALSKGLVQPETVALLNDHQIFQFLFEPGFSTVDQVTDISGRGVGLDVVKKNIQTIGGKVVIDSAEGKGTCFTIEFPKSITVKIIRGFLVAVQKERFILPLSVVGESFEVTASQITHIPGKGECITRHDKVFPLLRLASVLDLPDQTRKATGVGIILETIQRPVVLFVDEVLGIQQVVVKKIDGLAISSALIAGAAILGDERAAIVLNTDNL